MRRMSKPILVLLILIAFGVCVAQDTEKFAVELTSSPAAKRNELLAAHPEQITIALRKELIQHGNLRFAATDYTRALEIYQLVERIAAQIDDKEGLASTWLNMGSVYYFQCEYNRAIDHYQKAEAAFVALGNHLEIGRCRFGIALTYQSQRKPNEALKTFQEALKEFEAARDTAEIANTVASIGGLQYELGLYEDAHNSFLRVAESSPGGEAGKAQRGLGRNTEALSSFAEAIQVQRSIRPETGPDGIETERSGVLPYLGAMETLIDLDQAREALVRADEAKSQLLREVIQRGNFTITKGMSAGEREMELQHSGEVASRKVQVYDSQDSSLKRNDELKAKLAAARETYESFGKISTRSIRS